MSSASETIERDACWNEQNSPPMVRRTENGPGERGQEAKMKHKAVIATALTLSLLTAGTAHAGHGYRTTYYGHHHHGNGAAIGLGIPGAIIGTAIIADAISQPRVRYVAPAPTYYYSPPPTYYQAPAVQEDAYTRGYQDAANEARQYEAGRRQAVIDYGIGGNR